ncbi:hypothetical protein QJS66_10685 [Kocuria rhizophila]|nr:hypothetical protein QJS66_10685 [Kocuria rhizophila]
MGALRLRLPACAHHVRRDHRPPLIVGGAAGLLRQRAGAACGTPPVRGRKL